MKAVTQSHPLTWCGAGTGWLKRHSQLEGRWWLCRRLSFFFFSTPGVPLPFSPKRILLISMSRNLALGGNFVQNSSELPREQGGVPWRGCNLTLNNGSPGCSGTYWQLGRLTWSSTRRTVGCGKQGRIPNSPWLDLKFLGFSNQICGMDLIMVLKLYFIILLLKSKLEFVTQYPISGFLKQIFLKIKLMALNLN